MPKFRKRPVVVEAVQWDGQWPAIRDWLIALGGGGLAFPIGSVPPIHIVDGGLVVETLEGTMTASLGDWVIKGVAGEFYPCKPEIFDATYEPVEEGKDDLAAARSGRDVFDDVSIF